MKQFELNAKNRTKLMNPDMSCCNLTISLLMFILSVFTFYTHRDLNNEYFNRQLLFQKLMVNTDKDMMNFEKIRTISDFESFLETTIAMQIFEPEEARTTTDPDYISSYIF
jgi:hypothetical protein